MDKITPEQVIGILLKSCPSFGDKWEQYLKETEGDERLLYMEAGEFARHIVELFAAKKLEEFPDVFSSIEKIYENGTSETEELLTIGYLEGVQNIASWNEEIEDLSELQVFFGPKTKKEWADLDDFWQGKTPLVGVSYEELAKAHLEAVGEETTEQNIKTEVAEIKKRQADIDKDDKKRKIIFITLAILFYAFILYLIITITHGVSPHIYF